MGGPARFFVEARDEAAVLEALDWARARRLAIRVLGGGSNLVIADEGVDGLVMKIALRGIDAREAHGVVELTAAAGEPWDELVRLSVARGWAGFECLSGIPGLVGATPMQNVGAYGQEVSETVTLVRALDTCTSRRIMTVRESRVPLQLPRQPVPEPRARAIRHPLGGLPAAPGWVADRPIRGRREGSGRA